MNEKKNMELIADATERSNTFHECLRWLMPLLLWSFIVLLCIGSSCRAEERNYFLELKGDENSVVKKEKNKQWVHSQLTTNNVTKEKK